MSDRVFVDPAGRDAAVPVLDGLRVTLVGSGRAGRVLAFLLAGQGAHLAAYCTPGDESVGPVPSTDWQAVDLGGPDDVAGLRAAVEASDVTIDALPGGADLRAVLRLDGDAIRARGLVFCSFDDLPEPLEADTGASDVLIASLLGINQLGRNAEVCERLPVASSFGAIWAALLVVGALLQRERDGEGHEIDVSLLAAAITVWGRKGVAVERPGCDDEVTFPKLPMSRIYRCRDGRHVQNHGWYPRFVESLFTVWGREEWIERGAAGVARLPTREEADEWLERFTSIFLTRPALEWETRVNDAKGACTLSRTHDEWLAEPHGFASGIFRRDEATGEVGLGPTLEVYARPSEPGAPTAPAGPRAARGSDGWPAPPTPTDPSLPLAGLRVVDMCIVVAGPTCARTLAELGADVVKIDEPYRTIRSHIWLDTNRGKRSVVADVKTSEGRSVVLELIRSADVLVENFRDKEKLEEMGFGYDLLRELNPGLVIASLNAFDYSGPWAGRAGWEHSAQAATGMQMARPLDGVPTSVPFPANDYSTGLLCALGVMLALLRRGRGADDVRVTTSLVRSASLLQVDSLVGDRVDPAHRAAVTSRVHTTVDGLVRVLATPERSADLGDETAKAVAALPTADAVALLQDEGYACAGEHAIPDLIADRSFEESGIVVAWDHPRWGTMRQSFTNLGTSRYRMRPGYPAPDPGEDTRAVLRGLGYDDAAVDGLVARRAVFERMPLFDVEG